MREEVRARLQSRSNERKATCLPFVTFAWQARYIQQRHYKSASAHNASLCTILCMQLMQCYFVQGHLRPTHDFTCRLFDTCFIHCVLLLSCFWYKQNSEVMIREVTSRNIRHAHPHEQVNTQEDAEVKTGILYGQQTLPNEKKVMRNHRTETDSC